MLLLFEQFGNLWPHMSQHLYDTWLNFDHFNAVVVNDDYYDNG